MNAKRLCRSRGVLLTVLAVAAAALSGCSDQDGRTPGGLLSSRRLGGSSMSSNAASRAGGSVQTNPAPPAGIVNVAVEGAGLDVWPYTGTSFDGAPSDPLNLIFVGDADPAGIRAALMALDGDRSAFGLPNASPFNERWGDAIGDVQTSYAGSSGWTGSVIQLRLGEYAPLRVHLRLFRTGAPFSAGGTWTLGAAHFEVLIPGTADHQVLSWMVARQIITADLVRSGLLVRDPSLTEPIGAAPSFREIPEFIYNGLPDELKGLIGGPLGTASSPVPLASDGRAAVFHLKGTPAASAGSWSQRFSLSYGQVIPKPLCADGPLDWVYVQGPVELTKTASVDEAGRYQYTSRIAGRVTVTPVDITQTPPAPVGESFQAEVADLQEGHTDPVAEGVFARSRRIAPQTGGTELQISDLKVSSTGIQDYRLVTKCLAP